MNQYRRNVADVLAYYLADNLDTTADQQLIGIINHNYDCAMCGLTKQ